MTVVALNNNKEMHVNVIISHTLVTVISTRMVTLWDNYEEND